MMNRRKFLASASALSLPFILKSCNFNFGESTFPIEVNSAHLTGHKLLENLGSLKQGKNLKTEIVIVGGGVSGLTAATKLAGNTNFLVLEAENHTGGTSSSREWNSIKFAEGAHYELAYPENFGSDSLQFLKELNLIHYQRWSKMWSFNDRQYIISNRRKNRCFEDGEFREDVLPEGGMKKRFVDLMSSFDGKMVMPSRLIDVEVQSLNSQDFASYLKREINADEEFIRLMDYHMKDDWGGPSSAVSAPAGIHYFACRPYYNKVVELFSPPSGNDYFIEKMKAKLPEGAIKVSQLVYRIETGEKGVVLHVLNNSTSEVYQIEAEKVIFAANKHSLKYIYPKAKQLFNTAQAPWMVINFILENNIPEPGYWQNEMITEDPSFLGFIDSSLQYLEPQQHRVLTAYYCLPPESSKDLLSAEANKELIVEKTNSYLNRYFSKDIKSLIKKVFIRPIGHAMPIPGPGYLFKDANDFSNDDRVIYAGVDNFRLPLFFEAVDSGLEAVKRL